MRSQQWSDANTTNANQENAGHRRKRHESDNLLRFKYRFPLNNEYMENVDIEIEKN